MTDWIYPLPRWPLTVTTANRQLSIYSGVGGGPSTQNIPSGIYIVSGAGEAVAPKDLLPELKTALDAAAAALAIGGTHTVTMGADGKVTIARAGGTDAITIKWSSGSADQGWFGFATSASTPTETTIGIDSSVTSHGTASHQWHPGINEIYDSGEVDRRLVFETVSRVERPQRVKLNSTNWIKRQIVWDWVAAARMKQYRSDVSQYATVAGTPLGDYHHYENFLAYLMDGDGGSYLDHRFYLYDKNSPPASATREGPYYVLLTESMPGLDGVDVATHRPDSSLERFEVRLTFVN